MLALLILALAFPAPSARGPVDLPDVTARAWIVYDATYDYVVAASQPDRRLPMASTTKLMTALLVVEQTSPDEIVIISGRAAATGHKQLWAGRGEEWTVESLLAAVMIVSANDAAVALAEHVGGDVEAFVEMMNARAAELGLSDTHFVNPHGLHGADHYSSARDLLSLGRVAMSQPRLAALAEQADVRLGAVGASERDWESTNELLDDYDGAVGVKTGWTSRAGHVLVAAADRGARRVYVVVLDSDDPNADASVLFEHGFAAFGNAERRLVPLMDNSRYAEIIRRALPAETVARLGHLRGLTKRAEAPWE